MFSPYNNFSDTNEKADNKNKERENLKMELTWDEFLKLATFITNLATSIYHFGYEKIEIKEKNRRVAAAAKNYFEFFNDLKYLQFMNEVRTSLTKL